MKSKFIFLMPFLVAGCTSVDVRPADTKSIKSVCIVNNPQVIVEGFVDVVREGFSRHNIPTSIVEQSESSKCDTTLTYTALRSWDLTPYLSHAELHLWRNGIQIGSAQFHLNGKGGYALTKYKSVKSKMDPVVDQLLSGNSGNIVQAQAEPQPQPQPQKSSNNGSTATPYEPDPAKRCDACERIGKP